MVMKQVVRKKVDKIHAPFSFESLESIENESFEEQNPAHVVRNNEYLPHENVEPMSFEFGGMLEFNFDYHSFATQQNGIRSHKYATRRAISVTHNNQLSPMNDDALSIPTDDSDMEWKEKKNATSSDDEDSSEICQYCDESIIEEEFGVYYDSDAGNHRNYKRLERNKELIDPNSKLPNPEGGYDIYENGKILLRKWLRFRDHKHYRDVVKDFAVQEGFELRKVKHASSRITTICRAKGCKWRIHASKSPDGREFVIKTYNPEYNCQCVVKN
ncbi:hypothetical protein CsatB_001509 [Cannabis sativa]